MAGYRSSVGWADSLRLSCCRGKYEYIGAIPATIQGDPTRLRQILINVLGNAIKFTETGSVHLVTSLMEDGDEPYLQFEVIDTGRGMTEEQVAKLYTVRESLGKGTVITCKDDDDSGCLFEITQAMFLSICTA